MRSNETNELIDEIRWLANVDQVRDAWTVEKSESDAGYGSPEYYSVLFDDLGIRDAASMPDLSKYEEVVILEFARVLEIAALKDRALYDVPRLLEDPHFKIAQKIASLL